MSKDKKKNKKDLRNKSFRYAIIGTTIMIFVALITAITFGYFMKMINSVEMVETKNYVAHYAYIVDDDDGDFWDSVYESARDESEGLGIYLEDFRNSIQESYTNEDLLRVAVNSEVDGIIYAGAASDEAVKLINKACDKGMGVTVLNNDIDQSKRQCFVGVSNYDLGQMYASQIMEVLDADEMKDSSIEILVSSDMPEGTAYLIVMAIEDELIKVVEEETLPEIKLVKIDAEDTFSVEEDVRKIFNTDEDLPDVILCLESIYTQCAYQAMVDLNRVGETQIIGYSSNDETIDAIDKQIIFSTVEIDTDEMGRLAVDALNEYINYGYTNSYMPVQMEIIDKEKAEEMLNETESEDAEEL